MTNNAFNSNIPIEISKGGTNATSLATTDGTLYYDGTRIVTTATGNAGFVLTSSGSGSAPSYVKPSMKLIQTQNANNTSIIEFKSLFSSSLIGTARDLMLIMSDVKSVSDGVVLLIQMSNNNGTSYITTGYQSGLNTIDYNAGSALANTNSSTAWQISEALDTGSATSTYNATMYFMGVNIANYPHLMGQCSYFRNSSGLEAFGWFGGLGGSTGLNAIKIFMDSGNISSGTFSLYAMIP